DDDRLMAMALLQPGWEADYEMTPPLHPVVCIGRILKEERLSDGRYNLLLHGLSRARILEELPSDKLYRSPRVELLADVELPPAAAKRLREDLGRQLLDWFADQPVAVEQLRKLLQSNLSVGTLCDVFAFALPLDVAEKQQLLEDVAVEQRAHRLMAQLKAHR